MFPGVVLGKDQTAYVGSLLSGAIYQVDLHSGKGSLLVESDSQAAVGLAFDKRTGYLFAAGGPTDFVNLFHLFINSIFESPKYGSNLLSLSK